MARPPLRQPVRPERPPLELTPIGFEVLLSLAAGPLHGYGIKLAIEERTSGDVNLGSGTLYQAIQRLEREGLIAGASEGAIRGGDPRRGRTYRIEPLGRASLENHLRRLTRTVDYARAHRLLPSAKR
jgi:DNA-binding PadR family transcriptional regulator